MRCTLVVPGLLDWPSSALARVAPHAPALARLLGADAPAVSERDGQLAVACRACGIARQDDWPVAPWLARAAGVDVGSAYWLVADPAQFIVDASDVRLGGLIGDLDATEAATLVRHLNAHFAAEGLRFVAPTPSRWFACADPAAHFVTRPPEAALDMSLLAHLASGADALRWRRWQNELHMLLFEHAVNRQREAGAKAPVGGVWLWGGGTLSPPAAPGDRIFADGGLVTDLARSVGLAPEPLPAGFAALPAARDGVVWLRPLGGEATPEPLSAIDRAWMAPAEHALHAGQLRELALVLTGRALALGFRRSPPSLLQRWRQRVAGPRGKPPLARWIAEAAGN